VQGAAALEWLIIVLKIREMMEGEKRSQKKNEREEKIDRWSKPLHPIQP